MADKVLGSASVEVFADLSKLRVGLNEARRQTSRAASDMSQASATARRSFERAGDGLTKSVRGARVETERLNKELRNTDASLLGIFAGVGAASAVTGVVRLADEFTNLRARIGLVATEGENADAIFERLFSSAQRTGASVSALASLYVNLRQSIAGLGDAEAQNIAETLSQTLAISGANAAESASFIRQIGQALASGVLRGDEFNSVMESNSRFARLLAEQLGVGVGELRGMAEQGKLTADAIRGAIAGGGGEISSEFAELPLTIARATQQIGNALLRYVGQTDQGLGASRRLAEGIQLLAENFDALADAVILVGGAGLANILGRGVAGAANAAGTFLGAEIAASRSAVTAAKADLTRAESRARNARQLANEARGGIAAAEREIALAQAEIDRRRGMIQANERRNRGLDGRTPDLRDQRAERGAPLGGPRVDPDIHNRSELAIAERRLALAIGVRDRAQREAAVASGAIVGRQRAVLVAQQELNRVNGIAATAMRQVGLAGGIAARGFGSLVNVLGGPLPALITAVSVALLFYQSSADKARQANNSLADALGILANASTPAERGAADTASASEDLAEKTGLAAEAADALAGAHGRATDAARARTEAEKALAEVQRIQAIATLNTALADQRKRLAGGIFDPGPQARADANLRTINSLSGDGSDAGAAARQAAMKRLNANNAELAEINRSISLLERGISALQSGALEIGGAGAAASASTIDLSVHVETAAERAKRLKEEAREAALAVKTLQSYIDDGNQTIIEGEAELDRKANERQQARVDRAREIIDGATDQLTKLREQVAEIDDLSSRGLFAGEEATAGRAMVDVLMSMAEAAGDAAEALALLNTAPGLDGEAAAKASERIREAARQGRARQRDEQDATRIFRRSDISYAVSQGLYDGVTSGNWKDAFLGALQNVLGRALERGLEDMVDVIFSSGKGKSSGGGLVDFVGHILSGGFTRSGEGVKLPKRATGGPVRAGEMYQVNELGRGNAEMFVPSVNGYVLGAGATRAAAGTSAPARGGDVHQNISIDMRGAHVDEAGALEARLERAAQRGAMMGAELVERNLKANSTT